MINLFTKRKHNDYQRIVDLFAIKSEGDLPYINDDTTCKMVLLKKGTIQIKVNNELIKLVAPTAFYVSSIDKIELISGNKFQVTIIYYKPTVVNDSLQYDKLYNGELENLFCTTLYQDYLIIRNSIMKDGAIIKCCKLSDESLTNLAELINKMEFELQEQYDGFWPCRSRSYFIEIMFFLNFCYSNNPYALERENKFSSKVIEYLNNHIDEKIELDTLTNEFHINRNYLNQEFIKETGMTCLNYLTKIRLELAALWLKETGIPVGEIGRRVGYLDQNYFCKAFKKKYYMSPTEYREADSKMV